MKYTIILSDVHLEHGQEPHPSYRAALKLIRDLKPDHIVLNGDFADASYLSHYTAETPRLREGKRLAKDKDLLLSSIEGLLKSTKMLTYLEGNHEARVQKTIDHFPQLEGMIELQDILKLDELGVKWVPIDKQPFKLSDSLYVMHGRRIGKHFAAQNLQDYVAISIITGHTHRCQTYALSNNLTGATYEAIGSGCLTELKQSYTAGAPMGHTNGFVIIEWQSPTQFTIHNIVMRDCSFAFNGKWYDPR